MPAWIPIIPNDSPIAQGAWAAVDAIAHAVANDDYPPLIRSKRSHRPCDDSLLFAYMAVARGGQQWIDLTVERLNESVESASFMGNGLALFGGLCGIGWTLEHVSNLLEELPEDSEDADEESASDQNADGEDLNQQTDDAVLAQLRHPSRKGAYDLIGGPVGWGVYFLERFPRGKSEEGIALVVKYVEEIADRENHQATWFTPPESLPDWQRARCPGGYRNLGVAHGIPGILYFLAEAQFLGVEKARANRLLNEAMEWFLAQRHPADFKSWFSAWAAPDLTPTESRPTWCYGDLGILAVLLQVARRAEREDWRAFALELLDHCLLIPFDQAGVNDAPLCHGAAGCAHIFNRIYQAEADPRCRDVALAWFDRALAFRRPGEGVGGFFAFTKDDGAPPVWEPSPAFLDGAIGIALAFLAALQPVEPNWDRMLLLSSAADRKKLLTEKP